MAQIDNMTPAEFSLAMNEALEQEITSRRFADAHIKLFNSVKSLRGISGHKNVLKHKENYLKKEITKMREDFRQRKISRKAEIDRLVAAASEQQYFGGMFTPQTLQLPSFDDSESDDDRDDDYLDEQDFVVNEKEEELNESLLRRVTHATLRKELLDAGAPPSLLTLEVEPVAFDISRMMVELVSMLYKGQRCFMFALQPELHVDGSHDMNEAIRTLRVLSTLCNGAQGLSTFVGTGVYRDHVLYAQHCHDGATLKMLIMSVSDGDVRTSPSLQLALATDLAMAVKRLHAAGLVHGSIKATHIIVALDNPSKATLLFWNGPEKNKSSAMDVFALGVVFACLALGRVVTEDDLPSAPEIRSAGVNKEAQVESFLELIVQMTQRFDDSLRPTAAEVVEWLEAITDFSVPESSRRILETTTPFGDASSLYELQRPPSPMRLF